MNLRIGIAGITGRMGQLLAEEAAHSATLAGGTSRKPPPEVDFPWFPTLQALAGVSDIVIDFTQANTVQSHAATLAAAKTPWILGTTGLTPADSAAIAEAARVIPIIAAPNFSPGVNLVLILAERLAEALPADPYDAEILEMHHRQKLDSPSGTALALGAAVAAGRGVHLADVIRDGPRKTGDIGFAALRGGQIIGEHEVRFTAADEQITLSHRSFNRRVYATGALRAALWLHAKPPGRYTMRDVLGF